MRVVYGQGLVRSEGGRSHDAAGGNMLVGSEENHLYPSALWQRTVELAMLLAKLCRRQ